MATPAEPNLTETAAARRALDQVRPNIAQIVVEVRQNHTQAASGTGFLVSHDGLIISNYHVVADHVFEPTVYALHYKTPAGQTGELRVLAVDVANDLAVLASNLRSAAPLTLSAQPPNRGEMAYSAGYPLSQGLTITEGTFNGISEDYFVERFHFTGAINSGMSGGPALDRERKVIGINVASRRDAQLVNFLVPSQHAQKLLAQANHSATVPPAEVWRQTGVQTTFELAGVQTSIWERQRLGSFLLPARQHPRMRCAASMEHKPEQPFEQETLVCRIRSDIYVKDDLHVSSLRAEHTLYRDQRLGAWRFAQLVQKKAADAYTQAASQHHTQSSCSDKRLALKGFSARATLCVRGYRDIPELRDYTLHLVSLNTGTEALVSVLRLGAANESAAMAYIQRFVNSIEWTRAPSSK